MAGVGSSRLCLQPSASVSLKQEQHLQRKAWPQERQGALALADLNGAAPTSLEDVQQSKGGLFKNEIKQPEPPQARCCRREREGRFRARGRPRLSWAGRAGPHRGLGPPPASRSEAAPGPSQPRPVVPRKVTRGMGRSCRCLREPA